MAAPVRGCSHLWVCAAAAWMPTADASAPAAAPKTAGAQGAVACAGSLHGVAPRSAVPNAVSQRQRCRFPVSAGCAQCGRVIPQVHWTAASIHSRLQRSAPCSPYLQGCFDDWLKSDGGVVPNPAHDDFKAVHDSRAPCGVYKAPHTPIQACIQLVFLG